VRLLLPLAVVISLAPLGVAGAQGQAPAPVASLDSAWASIARTYYDTALVRGSWRTKYDSMRAALAEAGDDDVRRAIRELIAVPGKSHFALIPAGAVPTREDANGRTASGASNTPGTIGVDVRFVDRELLISKVEPGSSAERLGVRPGSAIVAIGRLSVDTIRARLAVAFPNDERQLRMLTAAFAKNQLAGNRGDTVKLTLRPARGPQVTVAVPREEIPGRPTQFGNLPPSVVKVTRDSVTIGRGRNARYVPVLSWTMWLPLLMQEIDAALFDARNAQGVIFDLRGNPGGVVGMIGGVAGHFTDTATNLGVMRGRGSTMNLRTNPRVVNNAGARVPIITAPVAILVDEFSASTTEFFAAGLQGLGRARVFGTTSSGQALPALMLRLPNGDVLMHPIADHVDATGRRVEGVGIVPDKATPLKRRDLVNGRDAAMDAARAWLERSNR
jgi:carboxyl-terminal processing protease